MLQAELDDQLQAERAAVEALSAQAAEAKAALDAERLLVEQLRKEATNSAEASAQLLRLEKQVWWDPCAVAVSKHTAVRIEACANLYILLAWQTCSVTIRTNQDPTNNRVMNGKHCICLLQEKESAQRATELAARALEAEKRLVDAMKDEAAASAEVMEAERAAKFAAQAEAAEIKRMLKEADDMIATQQEQATKVCGRVRTGVMTQSNRGQRMYECWYPCSSHVCSSGIFWIVAVSLLPACSWMSNSRYHKMAADSSFQVNLSPAFASRSAVCAVASDTIIVLLLCTHLCICSCIIQQC